MSYSAEELVSACGGGKRTNNGWDCKCPAHDDKTASLSINEDGIFYCHAGCSFEQVKAALSSLNINLNGTKERPFSTDYIYQNAEGKPVYKQTRFYPKDFRTFRYEAGGWVSGLGQATRVLYRLPELRLAIAQGLRVAIAEGEKDADRVTRESGILCTTNLGGAQQWRSEYTQEFSGADVTVFYDNDSPGIQKKERLIALLKPIVKKLTVVNLPIEYKDISDFWDAGLNISDEMKEVIELPKSERIDFGEWLETASYEFDPLVEGLFDAGDKVVIIGKSKTRKSFFAMQLLLSAVTGQSFLGFEIPKFRKAFLVQYEIKESHFHKRLELMCESMSILPSQLKGKISGINARGLELSREQIAKHIKESGAEIVLFDPIYKLMTEGENDVQDFKPLLSWFDKLAKDTGAAILYVHHDKKGFVGEQDLADRGAGSSILGRDFDAAFFLTPHETPELIGLEVLTRNYAPCESQSVTWANQFVQSDVPFQAKTSRSRDSKNKTVIEDWIEPALGLLADGPLRITTLVQKLNGVGCVQTMCRPVVDFMLDGGLICEEWKKNTKGPETRLIKLA